MTSYAGSEPSTAEESPSCSVRDILPPVSILTRCPQPDAHKCSPLAFPPEHYDPGVTWVLCHAWVPVRPTRSPPSQDLQQPEVPSLPSEAHEVLRTGQVGEMRSASPNPVAYPETPWHGLTPSPAASEPAVNTAGIPAEVSVLSRHARSVPPEGTRSLGGSSAPASSRCQLPSSFRPTLSTDSPSSSPSSDSSFSSSDRSRLPLRRGSAPIRRDFAHPAFKARNLHSASAPTDPEHIDAAPDTRVGGSTARSSIGEESRPRLVTFDPSAYRVSESPMSKLDAITESDSSDSDMDSSEDDQSTWHRGDPREFARQPRNLVESKKPEEEEPRTRRNHTELTSQGTGNGDTNEGDLKEDEIQTKTASPYYDLLGLPLGSSPKEARLAYMQKSELLLQHMQELQTPDTELDRMLMELKMLRNAYRLIFLSMSIPIEGAIAEALTASLTPAQPAEVRGANMSIGSGDVSKQDPHTVNKGEVPTWAQKRYDAHSTSSSTRESQTSRRPSWPRGNRPTPHPAKFLRLQ